MTTENTTSNQTAKINMPTLCMTEKRCPNGASGWRLTGTKACKTCETERPIACFPIAHKRTRKDGSTAKAYRAHCKPCFRKIDTARRKTDAYRTASKKRLKKRDKAAARAYAKAYAERAWRTPRQKQRRGDREARRLEVARGGKTCPGCRILRPLNEYYFSKDGPSLRCKSCCRSERDNLADAYVRQLLANRSCLMPKDIPPELVAAKKIYLKLYRELLR